jgi:hypothetical protein
MPFKIVGIEIFTAHNHIQARRKAIASYHALKKILEDRSSGYVHSKPTIIFVTSILYILEEWEHFSYCWKEFNEQDFMGMFSYFSNSRVQKILSFK